MAKCTKRSRTRASETCWFSGHSPTNAYRSLSVLMMNFCWASSRILQKLVSQQSCRILWLSARSWLSLQPPESMGSHKVASVVHKISPRSDLKKSWKTCQLWPLCSRYEAEMNDYMFYILPHQQQRCIETWSSSQTTFPAAAPHANANASWTI